MAGGGARSSRRAGAFAAWCEQHGLGEMLLCIPTACQGRAEVGAVGTAHWGWGVDELILSLCPRFSALHHAALGGSLDLISLLLEAQATVDIKDSNGKG